MCDPITLMTIGVSIAGSMVQYQGQQDSYDAQMARVKANADNANAATRTNMNNINTRAQQEGLAANQKKFESGLDTRAAVATAVTAAGEGNVSGMSVNAVLGDFYGKQGRFDAAVDTNQDFSRSYLAGEMDAASAQGQNQINSMPLPEAPNPAAMLVDIFGSAVSGYASRPTT